jgi:hypothetical protein
MGAGLDDDVTIKWNYNYFDIDYNESDRTSSASRSMRRR